MKQKNQLKDYLKYSGLAFQLGAIIVIFTYVGKWLDNRQETENPWFTVGFSLLGIGLGLYSSLKGLLKNDDESE